MYGTPKESADQGKKGGQKPKGQTSSASQAQLKANATKKTAADADTSTSACETPNAQKAKVGSKHGRNTSTVQRRINSHLCLHHVCMVFVQFSLLSDKQYCWYQINSVAPHLGVCRPAVARIYAYIHTFLLSSCHTLCARIVSWWHYFGMADFLAQCNSFDAFFSSRV